MGQERPELVHYARKKAVAFKLAGDLVGDAAWLRPGLRAGLQERAKSSQKSLQHASLQGASRRPEQMPDPARVPRPHAQTYINTHKNGQACTYACAHTKTTRTRTPARARTHTHTHTLSLSLLLTHSRKHGAARLGAPGRQPPTPFPSPAIPLALLRRARLHGRFRPSRAIHGPVPAWWGPPWAGSSPVGSSMGRFRPIRAPRGPVPALNLPLSCGGRGRGGGRPRGVARRTRPTCRCRAAGVGSTRHGSRGRHRPGLGEPCRPGVGLCACVWAIEM